MIKAVNSLKAKWWMNISSVCLFALTCLKVGLHAMNYVCLQENSHNFSIERILSSSNLWCMVGMEVKNYTATEMSDPVVSTRSGEIITPPCNIPSGGTGTLVRYHALYDITQWQAPNTRSMHAHTNSRRQRVWGCTLSATALIAGV